jgi:translation initiation factor 3 subunit A
LEVDFHPLLICQKIAPILEFLSSKVELEKYVKPLHNVVLTRLLNQLAQVYSSVSLDFVVKLASFPKPYDYDSFRIQKFILRGCQKREFHIRIDHFKKSLTFCDDFAQMENRNSKVRDFWLLILEIFSK